MRNSKQAFAITESIERLLVRDISLSCCIKPLFFLAHTIPNTQHIHASLKYYVRPYAALQPCKMSYPYKITYPIPEAKKNISKFELRYAIP